ncbi:MAG TPA: hypothetical protein VN958_10930 [Chitinophagaceae bacterium]|nr:hypothetical protein [Chitinophagaceae bacterium]
MVAAADKNFVYEFFVKEFEPFKLRFKYNGDPYRITVIPQEESENEYIPLNFNLIINGSKLAVISCTKDKWISDSIKDQDFVNIIGYYIYKRYE